MASRSTNFVDYDTVKNFRLVAQYLALCTKHHLPVWCTLVFDVTSPSGCSASYSRWITGSLSCWGFGSPFVTGSQSCWDQILVWQACSEEELHLWGRPARLGLGLCLFAVEKATWHRVSEATCASVSCPPQWGCVLLRLWRALGPPEGGDSASVYRLLVTLSPAVTFLYFLCFSLFAWGLRCFFVLCCGHSQRYAASWGWIPPSPELAVWMEGGMLEVRRDQEASRKVVVVGRSVVSDSLQSHGL